MNGESSPLAWLRPARTVPVTRWRCQGRWRPTPLSLPILIGGLYLFGTGEALMVLSGLGVSPWTVLAQGISLRTSLSIGWAKSIYPIEAFDSWSAEFKFAELVEGAPQVKAWTRIATDVPLTIAYTLGAASRTYRPDFIILDGDGTYWVVEGKADTEMADETVIAKRNAATAWVDAVNASDTVPQRWAYLLASETAIANASGWTQLTAAAFTHR